MEIIIIQHFFVAYTLKMQRNCCNWCLAFSVQVEEINDGITQSWEKRYSSIKEDVKLSGDNKWCTTKEMKNQMGRNRSQCLWSNCKKPAEGNGI